MDKFNALIDKLATLVVSRSRLAAIIIFGETTIIALVLILKAL